MKTIKPQKLSLMVRPFEFRRRFFLGVSAMGFLPLRDAAALLPEVAMWKFVAEQLGPEGAIDAAIPKSYGEFLVTGAAFPPGGPAPGVAVRARLGTVEKTLIVNGQRFWDRRQPTAPDAFTSMPLDWRHTWGGPALADNPLGMGIDNMEIAGRKLRPLPNVEYPQHALSTESQNGVPASFGPVDLMWPQRQRLAGTHDDRWLKEDFPGFARDIDTRFFNIAPTDQHFPGLLEGTEEYLLQHMHPERAAISGRLPGLVMRCFIVRKGQPPTEALEEVRTRLSTVWFFPHAERMVLIHHGSVEVTEEDARDITHILAGAEFASQPKDLSHYRQVMVSRLDPEYGAINALNDSDLLPVGMPAADEALQAETQLIEGEGLLRKRARQRIEAKQQEAAAHAASQGLDPAAMGLGPLPAAEPIPTLEQLPAFLKRKTAEALQTKADMVARQTVQEQAAHKLYAGLGINASAARQLHAAATSGPPAFSAKAQIAALQSQLEAARASGPVSPAMADMLGSAEAHAKLQDAEQKMLLGYRATAHRQVPAPSIAADMAARWRESAVRARAAGHGFAGIKLTGGDFSNMDLSGVDFSNALLESCNFQGANLRGCNFKGAVLAHARLQGAQLQGTTLTGINLGKAILTDADLSDADLTGATLDEADLRHVTLHRTRLDGASLIGTLLAYSDLAEASGKGLVLNALALDGASLRGARLTACIFIRCKLAGCDFSAAQLPECVFVGADLSGARFVGADISGARFVEQSVLDGADLQQARLIGTNLRGCRLNGANFSGATLDGADLSDSEAANASFHRASCINTQFVAASLQGASLVAANLRNAALIRSHIEGASLQGANLYSADLARVFADGRTVFSDTLALRTRTWPRWGNEQKPGGGN
ncbi:DUF2169 domain-containing protein [Viridibacterium curvum]|uniref:DUF2169 domain-containing protein n=1 Tax=Viridibacterium curvum TaxID=1101404 RepID=A0ABP9QPA5_9RHOO